MSFAPVMVPVAVMFWAKRSSTSMCFAFTAPTSNLSVVTAPEAMTCAVTDPAASLSVVMDDATSTLPSSACLYCSSVNWDAVRFPALTFNS